MFYRIVRTENYLMHHGIQGQKWGVRNGPPYPLKDTIKIKDIPIHKSVGAKYNLEKVYDPSTDEYYEFAPGSKIQDVEVFAGKGTRTPIHNENNLRILCNSFGGKYSDWQKVKGKSELEYYGEYRKAEIHWYQANGYGKHKFKLKEWLE